MDLSKGQSATGQATAYVNAGGVVVEVGPNPTPRNTGWFAELFGGGKTQSASPAGAGTTTGGTSMAGCPPPVLGAVYEAGGVDYVYLKDGLHKIHDAQIFDSLGFQRALVTVVDWSCISAIGTTTDLASDYPTAHAEYLNGMGVSGLVSTAGSSAPPALSGGVFGSLGSTFQQYEKPILIGGAILLAMRLFRIRL